ncbi:hypothetical protein SSYRP_v1c04160 [Spiroplasma syrphidicola EA-1]|uniref:Uncharacterized protein n=1 Tax=Spiroplasma syrphidicola EA-1 TaxID=1276229 RepID=R4UDM7_9MOLU|nr:hypothetical protein [Spiroplasma syrphidicola]AGM26009.1 hypothetical protein SSYRP_v1c04160 [Spiroplasma syrphidicola EA-1]
MKNLLMLLGAAAIGIAGFSNDKIFNKFNAENNIKTVQSDELNLNFEQKNIKIDSLNDLKPLLETENLSLVFNQKSNQLILLKDNDAKIIDGYQGTITLISPVGTNKNLAFFQTTTNNTYLFDADEGLIDISPSIQGLATSLINVGWQTNKSLLQTDSGLFYLIGPKNEIKLINDLTGKYQTFLLMGTKLNTILIETLNSDNSINYFIFDIDGNVKNVSGLITGRIEYNYPNGFGTLGNVIANQSEEKLIFITSDFDGNNHHLYILSKTGDIIDLSHLMKSSPLKSISILKMDFNNHHYIFSPDRNSSNYYIIDGNGHVKDISSKIANDYYLGNIAIGYSQQQTKILLLTTNHRYIVDVNGDVVEITSLIPENDLKIVNFPAKNHLFVASTKYLYQIGDNNSVEKVFQLSGTYPLIMISKDSSMMLVVSPNGENNAGHIITNNGLISPVSGKIKGNIWKITTGQLGFNSFIITTSNSNYIVKKDGTLIDLGLSNINLEYQTIFYLKQYVKNNEIIFYKDANNAYVVNDEGIVVNQIKTNLVGELVQVLSLNAGTLVFTKNQNEEIQTFVLK